MKNLCYALFLFVMSHGVFGAPGSEECETIDRELVLALYQNDSLSALVALNTGARLNVRCEVSVGNDGQPYRITALQAAVQSRDWMFAALVLKNGGDWKLLLENVEGKPVVPLCANDRGDEREVARLLHFERSLKAKGAPTWTCRDYQKIN